MESPNAIALSEIVKAIHLVQNQLVWKPDSAARHLRRRISRGHLLATATIADYESVIRTVVVQPAAQVYLYWYSTADNRVAYVSVVGLVDDQQWLVMFSFTGVLESAYIVERPQYYLSEPEFERICALGDIL